MRRAILSFLVLTMALSHTSAQQLRPVDVKKARNAVYQWISDYNGYAECEGKNAEKNFSSLFTSADVEVYNDYYPMENYDFKNNHISQIDYVALLHNRGSFYRMRYEITNGMYTNEVYNDGIITYYVTFNKEVMFFQRDSRSDDRYEYPSKMLDMNATLEYDIAAGTMKASKLSCTNPPEFFLVLHDGENNSYETEYSVRKRAQMLSTPLVAYTPKHESFDRKMVTFSRDTLKNGFGIGYAIGYENVDAPISDKGFKGYTIEGGIMNAPHIIYYRQMQLRNRNRLGIETELWLKSSTSKFKTDYYDSYQETDADGGRYQRQIAALNYEETHSRKSLEIPISFKYERFARQNVSIFGKAGISAAYELNTKIESHGDMDYRGYYDWLFDVTLSQNGIYDFGQYKLEATGDATAVKKLSLAVLAQVGVSYYFADRWMASLSFRYRSTVWGKTDSMDDYHLSRKDGDWNSLTYAQDRFDTHLFTVQLFICYNF